jgi:hypothetical protein
MTREVRSSYGYLCANDLRVIFGLGQRTRVDRLEVRWPSGIVQTFEDLGIDRLLVIEETE